MSESTKQPICECWFLDVGQGTSNVILLGNGRAIVIDCGPHGSQQAIALLRKYVDTIEVLIVSHNDADHDYTAPQILSQYRKAINRIFFLQDRNVQEMRRTFAVLRNAHEGDYPTPQRLETNGGAPRILYSKQNVTLTVMYPDFMANLTAQSLGKTGSNQTSAILRLVCGRRRIIFSGDATTKAWEYLSLKMSDRKPLRCDIMTIPHHGGNITNNLSSKESDQEKLYSEVIRPTFGVVSVGTNNQYGHPSRTTISTLRQAGVKILCTQMTDKCCDDLESIRSLRSIITKPARSMSKTVKTRGGKSKHVACFGTIVAEISTDQITISGWQRYQLNLGMFDSLTNFHPLCCPDKQ